MEETKLKKCQCGCGQSFPAHTGFFYQESKPPYGLVRFSKECMKRKAKEKREEAKNKTNQGLSNQYSDFIYC